MDNNDLLRWYLSNRNMGSVVPSTGRAVQSGGTAMVPYTGNPVAHPSTAMSRAHPPWWGGEWSEVPKALSGPKGAIAQRAATTLADIMPRAAAGTLAGATGWPMLMLGAGDGRPDNSASDIDALAQAYKADRTNANYQVQRRFGAMQPSSPMTPNQQVADRFGGMQPPTQPTPNDQVANRFGGMQPPEQALAYAPPAPNRGNMTVPVPRARPQHQVGYSPADAAPQAQQPQMSWFQRNAAMMHDPVTGGFIDPQGAAVAQGQLDQGSIIKKMIGYLHQKADNA